MMTSIVMREDVGDVARLFNERLWTKQGTWTGSFLWFAAILESFSEECTGQVLDSRLAIRDYACIGQSHGAYDCLIGALTFEEMRRIIEHSFSELGSAYFRDYASLCEKKCNEWLHFSQSIAARGHELERLSNSDLAELLRQYFAHLRQNGAFMDTIIVLADVLGDVVGTNVAGLLEENGIDDPAAYGLFLELQPRLPLSTNMIMAENSIREMAKRIRQSPALRDLFDSGQPSKIATTLKSGTHPIHTDLQEHVERFGWLNTYSFLGQPFTVEQIIGFVQERLDNFEEVESAHPPSSPSPSESELGQRLLQIKVSSNLRELLEVTHVLTYINAVKDDAHQISWRDIQPLIRIVAQRLECSTAEVTLCTPEELLDSLYRRHLNRELLTCRVSGWALLKISDTMYVIQGSSDMETLRRNIKSFVPKDISILSGKPIFPGRVRGQARLVLTANDCDKVRTGDILVATNTNPDFIPAMRRASAFVTDTGNLICHAVIAAREFKKPCVISTQIATQLFKDGELLEVDGTVGTVIRISADLQS